MNTEQLLQDYKSKMKTKDIMLKYNISWNKMTRILKQHDVYKKNNSLTYSDEIIDYIKQNYNQIANIDIARHLNISEDWLSVVAKKLNLPIKGSGWKFNSFIKNLDYNSNEFQYFLGWIASDGNISKTLYTVSLSITDNEVIEKFTKLFPTANLYMHNYNHRKTMYQLNIGSKELATRINAMGITPNKSYTLSFPIEKWTSHFLRGFFEGDGHVRTTNPGARYTRYEAGFVSASEVFMEQLCLFLSNNGIKTHTAKEKNCYRVRIAGKENLFVFYNLIYKDCNDWFLKRKKQIFDLLYSNV